MTQSNLMHGLERQRQTRYGFEAISFVSYALHRVELRASSGAPWRQGCKGKASLSFALNTRASPTSRRGASGGRLGWP